MHSRNRWAARGLEWIFPRRPVWFGHRCTLELEQRLYAISRHCALTSRRRMECLLDSPLGLSEPGEGDLRHRVMTGLNIS